MLKKNIVPAQAATAQSKDITSNATLNKRTSVSAGLKDREIDLIFNSAQQLANLLINDLLSGEPEKPPYYNPRVPFYGYNIIKRYFENSDPYVYIFRERHRHLILNVANELCIQRLLPVVQFQLGTVSV